MQAGLACQLAVELSPHESSFEEALCRVVGLMPFEAAAALQVSEHCMQRAGSVSLAPPGGLCWLVYRQRNTPCCEDGGAAARNPYGRPEDSACQARLECRAVQAGGSSGLREHMAREAEEALPEYRRTRPKYYYYSSGCARWADRVSAAVSA